MPTRGCRVSWLAVVQGVVLAWASASGLAASKKEKPDPGFVEFTGCCDASAGVALTDTLVATASDEDNILRLYRVAGGPPPVTLNLAPLLSGGARDESDLEAGARLGDRVYWIGSHARNADGKPRPGRHVLFATAVVVEAGEPRLRFDGRPYRGLGAALATAPALAPFRLGHAALLGPEERGGLNIEGLAAGPDGSLWIGFRNPIPDGLALVVPLLNPGEVIHGTAARLGSPVRLDLAGLGIRDMARAGDALYVIAGPAEGGGRHRLFRIRDGAGGKAEEISGVIPKSFQAEGLVLLGTGAGARLLLLGDEGGEKVQGRKCEELRDPAARRFRGVLRPLE